MLHKFSKISIRCFLLIFLITGCTKNYTNYYPDAEDPELAIFSNNANELMTCYVNQTPWRTNDRIYSSGITRPFTRYEVNINRQITNSPNDTLIIDWNGYAVPATNGVSEIILRLPISKNFNFRNFSAYMGRRMHIDNTNGSFLVSMVDSNIVTRRAGSGNIYFHTAQLDSIGPGNFIGKMSGLFDADFGDLIITRGRFDHSIDGNIFF